MDITAQLIKKQILNYGILLGIASVVFGVILYVTDHHGKQSWITSSIGIILMIIAIVLGIKAFKASNNQLLSLSQALKIGIGTALIGGIIMAVWMILLMTVIEPDMVEQIVKIAREQMIRQHPNMTKDQIDMGVSMTRKFTSPTINSAMVLIANLFLGLIISVITGFIMKKEA